MSRVAFYLMASCVFLSSACTTLQPKETPPEDLQRQLTAGQLLEPGDPVRLVTVEETVHKGRVIRFDVTNRMVTGRDRQVPIVNIVAGESSRCVLAGMPFQAAQERCNETFQ